MGGRKIFLTVLICLCVTRRCRSRLCDNGKANLTIDLPEPEELVCEELWTQSQMNILDIDTKHTMRAADSLCMDTPIKYNEHIPTHGPYRPVEAESGEYLYCPPQRWLNNLKNGAVVFLYHPCVSAEAHRSLAVLAHSCLPHYILTPHPWLSQHRPFAVVSSGRSIEMSRITLRVCDWLLSISFNISQASTSKRAKYNLYLTKPAPVDKPVNTGQEMSKVERLKSLKHCCMEALNLSEVQRSRRRTRTVLKRSPEEVKLTETVKSDELNNTESTKLNRKETLPQNNTKEMDSFSMLTISQSHGSAKNFVLSLVPSTASSKTTEKQFPQTKVTEKPTHKKTIMEGKKHRIKTDTKASASECREFGQCGVPNSKSAHIEGPIRGERIPLPRTDEAVWAAGALGFLLVLLTLSVLHTRLYRHCRPSTSLYWHDNHQEYENVGDIIRRRLRKFRRRKRRSRQSRRQECPLLSNSSNDEDSD